MPTRRLARIVLLFAVAGFGGAMPLRAQSVAPAPTGTPAITELERFILTESALAKSGEILPTSRPVDSVFAPGVSLLDTPRSVTVLTPELLRMFGVRDFGDLSRVTAGGERPNYYGVPGTPILRGDFAGVFFNGMQRAWQRNEMPTSFGSLEGMDLVKGPAPGNFGPTQAGGYVNFLPKSPYYDRARGSLRVTAGSHEFFNGQLDYGSPLLAFGRPAAFRVSVTAQEAGSYYRNVRNDFASVYSALKVRLADNVSLFTGAEYYRFQSNENAGWNRVTQALIDRGEYIVGEVRNATSAAGGGFVLPRDVPFIAVFGAATPGSAALDASGGAILAPPDYVASLPASLRSLLGPNGEYTSAFFNAGGRAQTVRLDGRTALTDPNDFANSQSVLAFADLVDRRRSGLTLKNQLFVDWLETDKRSSYGYAFASEQFVVENKFTVDHARRGRLARLVYGGSLRYQWAHQLQDFSAEPFSRRDISRPITPNSVVLSGGQRPLSGDTRNLWAQGDDTQLGSAGLFTVANFEWSERWRTLASVRIEGARFDVRTPMEFERSPTRGRKIASGGKNYTNVSLNPIFKATPGVSLYGAFQYGTALNPSQGGTITGERNFGETELAELGVKTAALDATLFASVAAYYSTLSRFNNITNNPFGLRTKGVELEATWAPTPRFALIANASLRRTEQTNQPGFRFAATQDYYLPMVAGGLYADFGDNNGLLARNNPDTVFPGSPERVANLFARFEFAREFALAAGPTIRSAYWHNPEHTLRLPATVIWNANLSWQRGRTSALLELTNVFSEDWFYGSEPTFAANTVITKAPPLQAKLSLTFGF